MPSFVAVTTFASATGSAKASNGMPAGITADDLLIAACVHRSDTTAAGEVYFNIGAAGWTRNSTSFIKSATAARGAIELWYRVATSAGEPAVTVSAQEVVAQGWSVTVAAWRGVDTTTPFDVASVTSFQATSANTWQPTGITPSAASAQVVSFIMGTDDQAISANAADLAGFTLRASGTTYETTQGADHELGIADRAVTTPASTACPLWDQIGLGVDRYAAITVALRPASAAVVAVLKARRFPLLGVV